MAGGGPVPGAANGSAEGAADGLLNGAADGPADEEIFDDSAIEALAKDTGSVTTPS